MAVSVSCGVTHEIRSTPIELGSVGAWLSAVPFFSSASAPVRHFSIWRITRNIVKAPHIVKAPWARSLGLHAELVRASLAALPRAAPSHRTTAAFAPSFFPSSSTRPACRRRRRRYCRRRRRRRRPLFSVPFDSASPPIPPQPPVRPPPTMARALHQELHPTPNCVRSGVANKGGVLLGAWD